MPLFRLTIVLPVVVATILLAGLLSITLPNTSAFITAIGVLLVIVGLMGLMPIVRLHLSTELSDV